METAARKSTGPVCRLPSGRIVGCEYRDGDPSTSVPHVHGCQCDRCEPELAAARERVRDASAELLAVLERIVRYHEDAEFAQHLDEVAQRVTSGNCTALDGLLARANAAIADAAEEGA